MRKVGAPETHASEFCSEAKATQTYKGVELGFENKI
jgi:hypothetical protein